MNDKNMIRKQLLKNMVATLIAFSIIFITFSSIIYNQVKTTMYKNIDKELTEFLSKDDNNPKRDRIDISPRVTYIIRNEEGKVVNSESIGRFYEEYLINSPFDPNNINQISDLVIGGKYNYRGVIYKVTSDLGQTRYVQLLANVDAEVQVLKRFSFILSFSTIISILISIMASYLLSKRTIKPLVDSWEKQTQFVQDASHELRTPLTIIQAKIEMLLQKPESKIIENTEDIRISLNETKRLAKLIRDLMTLARADAKKHKLEKQLVNIDEVIMELSIPYKEFAEIDGKKFNISMNYGKQIEIDVNKIKQLLIILFDNAIKYTETGDNIEVKTYQKDGKFILEVKDTGIGIDDNSIKHIFDRFYRADKARTRETGGTGLGLAIAKTIVEMHAGSIKAIHNEPKGIIFTVYLK